MSGRHGLEVKTSQGRHAEAIGERALSTRREIREISSPYLSRSHCWSRCTSTIPFFKMVSSFPVLGAETSRQRTFRLSWQTNRQTSSRRSSNGRTWTKKERKRASGDGCSVDLKGSMCRWENLFGAKQTTTYESWQLFQECNLLDVVASGSWMHKDDGE